MAGKVRARLFLGYLWMGNQCMIKDMVEIRDDLSEHC